MLWGLLILFKNPTTYTAIDLLQRNQNNWVKQELELLIRFFLSKYQCSSDKERHKTVNGTVVIKVE